MVKELAPNRIVFIYALQCPLTDRPCYVGQSIDPNERLKMHTSPRHAGNEDMRQWAKELEEADATPEIVVLETCSADSADDREDYWIKKMLTDGHDLMNKNFRGQTWHSRKKWKPQ